MPRRSIAGVAVLEPCAVEPSVLRTRRKKKTLFLGMVEYSRIQLARRLPIQRGPTVPKRTREKITVHGAKQIFALGLRGSHDSAQVARMNGIAPKTVRDIWNGRTWRQATQGLCISTQVPGASRGQEFGEDASFPEMGIAPQESACREPEEDDGFGPGCITKIDACIPSYEDIGYETSLDIAGAGESRSCMLLECSDAMIEGTPLIEEASGQGLDPVRGDGRAHDEELLDSEAIAPYGIAQDKHKAVSVQFFHGEELL